MELSALKKRENILNKEYQRIFDIIKREYKPEKVVIFGSFSEKKIHEWSDIDMLIIKKTTVRPVDRCVELCRLVKPKVGIDMFIYTPDEYSQLINEEFSFLLEIIKKGKVVYEKRN
ncbi:MAG: nucleotidyltransferase domain-containing protein [Candidatus Anammoxibacter sp.]